MKTRRSLKWTLIGAVAAYGVFGALQGCELIVDFDRSKIPSDSGFEEDALISDGGEVDALPPGNDATSGGDASDATVSTADGATDAGPGADVVVAPDGASDAASDGPTIETESDAETDGGTGEVPDAGTDASPPQDATIDTGIVDSGVVETSVVDTGVAETGSPPEASTPVDAGTDSSTTGSDAALDAPAD